jgi:hypothetical protein
VAAFDRFDGEAGVGVVDVAAADRQHGVDDLVSFTFQVRIEGV